MGVRSRGKWGGGGGGLLRRRGSDDSRRFGLIVRHLLNGIFVRCSGSSFQFIKPSAHHNEVLLKSVTFSTNNNEKLAIQSKVQFFY